MLRKRIDQAKLRVNQTKAPVFGDLFSNEGEAIEQTVDCINGLVDIIIGHYDYKIEHQNQLTAATFEIKSLQSQLDRLKSTTHEETDKLRDKVKSLQEQCQAKKKEANHLKIEMESEKSAWANKERQYLTDIRRKDVQIKAWVDKSISAGSKGAKLINGVEAIGEIGKSGRMFYKDDLDIEEISRFNHKFKALLQENAELHGLLNEVFDLVVNAVRKRSQLAESIEIDAEGNFRERTKALIGLKDELRNLRLADFKEVGLRAMKDNLRYLFDIFDKIDSYRIDFSIGRWFQTKENPEIDCITDVKSLQDIIKRYDSFVSSQLNLIKLAVHFRENSNFEPSEVEESLVTERGMKTRQIELKSLKDRLLKLTGENIRYLRK